MVSLGIHRLSKTVGYSQKPKSLILNEISEHRKIFHKPLAFFRRTPILTPCTTLTLIAMTTIHLNFKSRPPRRHGRVEVVQFRFAGGRPIFILEASGAAWNDTQRRISRTSENQPERAVAGPRPQGSNCLAAMYRRGHRCASITLPHGGRSQAIGPWAFGSRPFTRGAF